MYNYSECSGAFRSATNQYPRLEGVMRKYAYYSRPVNPDSMGDHTEAHFSVFKAVDDDAARRHVKSLVERGENITLLAEIPANLPEEES